jgi:hypothetical protein
LSGYGDEVLNERFEESVYPLICSFGGLLLKTIMASVNKVAGLGNGSAIYGFDIDPDKTHIIIGQNDG